MKLKVLIVEDETDLREMLVDALQEYSFEVDQASGVNDAYFLIKLNNYA